MIARSAHAHGAAASINRRIIPAAAQLLQQRRDYAALPVRFDVLLVSKPASTALQVEWLRHAFEA